MIHIVWNTLIPGTPPLPASRPTSHYLRYSGALENILRRYLPATWTVKLEGDLRGGGPDALLVLEAPDGETVVGTVEIKTGLQPRDIPRVAEQLERFGPGPKLLAAPFLTPWTREALTDRGISYLDLTGNVRIVLEKPAVFIYDRGLDSDPWREERSLRSLKGPTAGRVVRALCDFCPPYGVRELAQKSGTAQASVSRVLSFLEPEGLVIRDDRGGIVAVDWANLIRRWTQDYSLIRSNATYTFLEPRGLKTLRDKLAALPTTGGKYAVTGSLAAAEVAAYAPTRLATMYAESPNELTTALGLHPAESGTNVLIAEPFDPVVFDRTWQRGQIIFSALSQVAADLLTSPGRGPAEGEELIRWMQAHENEWRS